jgi:hypothetical protein
MNTDNATPTTDTATTTPATDLTAATQAIDAIAAKPKRIRKPAAKKAAPVAAPAKKAVKAPSKVAAKKAPAKKAAAPAAKKTAPAKKAAKPAAKKTAAKAVRKQSAASLAVVPPVGARVKWTRRNGEEGKGVVYGPKQESSKGGFVPVNTAAKGAAIPKIAMVRASELKKF